MKGFRGQNPYSKSFVLALKNYPYNEILGITHSIPAKELPPDYYDLKLIVKDGKEAMKDEATKDILEQLEEEDLDEEDRQELLAELAEARAELERELAVLQIPSASVSLVMYSY